MPIVAEKSLESPRRLPSLPRKCWIPICKDMTCDVLAGMVVGQRLAEGKARLSTDDASVTADRPFDEVARPVHVLGRIDRGR